jgi:hypothetical protein
VPVAVVLDKVHNAAWGIELSAHSSERGRWVRMAWMYGCVGEWMDGWMDGWMDKEREKDAKRRMRKRRSVAFIVKEENKIMTFITKKQKQDKNENHVDNDSKATTYGWARGLCLSESSGTEGEGSTISHQLAHFLPTCTPCRRDEERHNTGDTQSALIHSDIHTYIHTCIHTYMHTYRVHTYIGTYIVHTYYIHTT